MNEPDGLMATCVPISIHVKRAQQQTSKLDSLIKQKHRKMLILLKKMPEKLNLKRARDKRLSEVLKNMYAEIKDLSSKKSESWKILLNVVEQELRKVDYKIEQRNNYLTENDIRLENALEYTESHESLVKWETNIANKQKLCATHKRKLKGKKKLENTSCEDSLLANSETYAYSSTTNLKSPSIMDTLSVFEGSPMLKRVKISEEEEKNISKGDSFNIGESSLGFQNPALPVRKSMRKKKMSKILREAVGEEENEKIVTTTKPLKKYKESQEISKIIEMDSRSKKREEPVPQSKSHNYLVEYEYDFGSQDPKPVCFCQTFSFGQMVACDNKSWPIEWFHFGWVGLRSINEGIWYCQRWTKDIVG